MDEIKVEEIKQDALVTTESNPIMQLLQMAVDKNLDMEKLERLMQMKKDWDAEQARIAFNEAMALFQSKCPVIAKGKIGGKTKDGTVAYKYAELGSIVAQTKDIIAENGFSYVIKTDIVGNKVNATCIVKHRLGHSESSSLEVPLLTRTGVMSDAQVVAGTSTFAKRYAFCNAFGIMTADEDNDGIDTTLQNIYADLVSHYKYKNYVDSIEVQVETANAYKKFLDDLPTAEQADKLNSILVNIEEQKVKNIWGVFQRHNKESATKFLSDIEQQIKSIKQT